MSGGNWKRPIQKALARAGYQLRKADPGTSIDDPYAMQLALLGPEISTVFEVGAADGRDTERYLADYPEATIYAFEPVPESLALVRRRAERNRRLVPVPMAVSDRVGEATFNVTASQDSSSLLPSRETGSRFDEAQRMTSQLTVGTTTVDGFCAERGIEAIDLLKIDAQGAEAMILAGAERMLNGGTIQAIFLEVQFLPSYEGAARYDELAATLYGHGFSLHSLYDLHHNHRGRLCWGDALFVRRDLSPEDAPDRG